MKIFSRTTLISYSTVLLFFLLFASTAIAFPFGGKKTQEAPEWFLNRPADTPTELYGVAMRNSLEAAKKAALTDIAATLGIKVSQETIATQISDEQGGRTTQTDETRTKIGDTEFSNYKVTKTAHDAKTSRYWVLVKVDKIGMVKDIDYNLDKLAKELANDFTHFQSQSLLDKVMSSGNLREKTSRLASYCSTRRGLDSTFDSNPILADIRDKESQLEQARAALVVTVKHDANTKQLAQELEALLTDNRIKVVNAAGVQNGVQNATVIAIEGDVRYFNILKDHQAKLDVKLQAIDAGGKVLATSNHMESGASRSSDVSALEQANYKLAKRFEDQGLLKSLGF